MSCKHLPPWHTLQSLPLCSGQIVAACVANIAKCDSVVTFLYQVSNICCMLLYELGFDSEEESKTLKGC